MVFKMLSKALFFVTCVGCVNFVTSSLSVRSQISLQDVLTRKVRQTQFDSQWTDINPDHTMCLDDVGTEVVLTQETKDALLALHNTLRGQVDPPAANMPKLTWDDDLALVASKWARQCVVGHDSGSERQVPSLPGVYVGQNGAFGYGNFLAGVESGWGGEVEDFKYGEGSINGGVVGHYTQMATDRSQRIGCGEADCPNSSYRRFYFCNYAVGQFSSDTLAPYANGTSCSGCPGHCDDSGSLCECGGLLCLNGGSVDVSTCSCNCPGIWGGDMCEIPTAAPTNAPTDAPTNAPTDAPTNAPTDAPTNAPTDAPTEHCETSGK